MTPTAKLKVYKVTTECRLNTHGIWIYSAKLYYQIASVKSIETITAPTYNKLLKKVKNIGTELLKHYNQ